MLVNGEVTSSLREDREYQSSTWILGNTINEYLELIFVYEAQV